MRRPEGDPVYETLMCGDWLNLPPICQVGRPRVNWIIHIAKDAWTTHEIYLHAEIAGKYELGIKNQSHIRAIVSAANMNIL